MKKTTLILTLLFTGMNIFNQVQPIKFDEISYKEGLNSLNQYPGITVFQDHKGFIWMSGGNGLHRYDGYGLVDYSNQIKNHWYVKFMEDSRDILWISSADGIHLFNLENEKMNCYFPDSAYRRINKVFEDRDGIIWCVSYGLGLLRMEPLMKDESQLMDVIFKKGLGAAFKISAYKINKTEISKMNSEVSPSIFLNRYSLLDIHFLISIISSQAHSCPAIIS